MIGGQHEEGGIKASNNSFDEDNSDDVNKFGDKAIGGQHEEGGINKDPQVASDTDHKNVQT